MNRALETLCMHGLTRLTLRMVRPRLRVGGWNPRAQRRGEAWDSFGSDGPVGEIVPLRSCLRHWRSGRRPGCDRLLRLRQLVEDRAVLNHRGAKLFGSGLGAGVADGDAVSDAIVFHHARIGDRDIGCALLKAGHGIAAGFEERIDQVIGLSDSGAGMIDEAGLNDLPLTGEAFPLGNAEIPNWKGFHAALPIGELRFGVARGAVRDDGAIVF